MAFPRTASHLHVGQWVRIRNVLAGQGELHFTSVSAIAELPRHCKDVEDRLT